MRQSQCRRFESPRDVVVVVVVARARRIRRDVFVFRFFPSSITELGAKPTGRATKLSEIAQYSNTRRRPRSPAVLLRLLLLRQVVTMQTRHILRALVLLYPKHSVLRSHTIAELALEIIGALLVGKMRLAFKARQ